MDLKTWAPFQSALERHICERMTTKEKEEVVQFGSISGLLCAIFIGIPVGFGVGFGVLYGPLAKCPWMLPIMVGWITIGIFVIIRRRQRGKRTPLLHPMGKTNGIQT